MMVELGGNCGFEIRTTSATRDKVVAAGVGLSLLSVMHWWLGVRFLLHVEWAGAFLALLSLLVLVAAGVFLAPCRLCNAMHDGMNWITHHASPGSFVAAVSRRLASELRRETAAAGPRRITVGLAMLASLLVWIVVGLPSALVLRLFPSWSNSGAVWSLVGTLHALVVVGGVGWLLRDYLWTKRGSDQHHRISKGHGAP
jgi:hypothetical protein